MKNFSKYITVGVVFFLSACSLTDLEGNLDNPNEVGVASLDVNLLNNKIQAEFGDFFAEVNFPSMELSRQSALIGGNTYATAYNAQDLNDIWNRAYEDVLIQIETLLSKTDGNANFALYSGTSRVMKAYVLLTLVDLFGNVPYSQALKGGDGAASFNPAVDSGRSIYDAAITMLDEAITLFGTAPAISGSRDIYYSGNKTKWAALARTLKLKAYVNLRLTDTGTATTKIAELLTQDLIDTDAEEFTYKYGTASTPVRSRHPLYRQMYGTSNGDVTGYINNHYMKCCYDQKGVEDPRWRYYFYRQVGSIATALDDEPESVPCVISPFPSHYPPGMTFCSFDPGFFGRDHGNNDGIPPDGRALTCYGVYPSGGRVDNHNDPSLQDMTLSGQGGNGAGIEPIWMASYTDFLKAEIALKTTAGGDAAASLAAGVTKSIARVKAMGASLGQTVDPALAPDEAAYLAKVNDLFATETDKLNVVAKEYYIALFGNGIEAYNLYRRTQRPADMQPMRASTPGKFIYSLIYPSDFVNLNNSTAQKVPTAVNQVFWDNNPDNLSF